MIYYLTDVDETTHCFSISPEPADAGEIKSWASSYWNAVHPHNLDGAYPNFMMTDEGEDRIKATFGANYGRLAQLKQKFDPGNLFHVNHNIHPSG